jgi:hypothetical protein
LESVFRRTTGGADVDIGFPVGAEQQLLLLSAIWKRRPWHSINAINGDPIKRHGELDNNRDYAVLLRVKHDEAHVAYEVRLDGKALISWNGAIGDLSTSLYWVLPRLYRPALGAWGSDVTFKQVQIRLLTEPDAMPGKGYLLDVGEDDRDPFVVTPLPANHGCRFRHVLSPGSYLVGLRLEYSGGFTGVQPIYRTPKKVDGPVYRGQPGGKETVLIAKPGDALGAIDVYYSKTGNGISVGGVRAVFMPIKKRRLLPHLSYESRWVGNSGEKTRAEGDYQRRIGIGDNAEGDKCLKVVGITGSMEGGKCRCLGLVLTPNTPEPKWLKHLTAPTKPPAKKS